MNLQEPAFPITQVIKVEDEPKYIQLSTSSGMSLRDYFAAKAMQGFAANPNYDAALDGMAIGAYRLADAMLLERSKNDK